MAKYRATATVTGSKYLGEFEAPSAAEAERMARESDEASVSLCHQCTDEVEDPEVRELFTELRQEEVEHMQMVREQMKRLPEGDGFDPSDYADEPVAQ